MAICSHTDKGGELTAVGNEIRKFSRRALTVLLTIFSTSALRKTSTLRWRGERVV